MFRCIECGEEINDDNTYVYKRVLDDDYLRDISYCKTCYIIRENLLKDDKWIDKFDNESIDGFFNLEKEVEDEEYDFKAMREHIKETGEFKLIEK